MKVLILCNWQLNTRSKLTFVSFPMQLMYDVCLILISKEHISEVWHIDGLLKNMEMVKVHKMTKLSQFKSKINNKLISTTTINENHFITDSNHLFTFSWIGTRTEHLWLIQGIKNHLFFALSLSMFTHGISSIHTYFVLVEINWQSFHVQIIHYRDFYWKTTYL